MVWPQLSKVRWVSMPLTGVFNSSVTMLELHNPASEPVIAQVLFLQDYPSPSSLLNSIKEQ